MKPLKLAISITIALIVLTGCGKQSPLAGRWSTTEPFGDETGMATAETVLSHEGEVVSGTFKFKSLPDAARKELGTNTFSLEQVSFIGGRLTFVVPIAPAQPKECLLFNLQLDGDKLKGTAKENRPEVQTLIPVVFKKER
jgi:hypothetical protein